MTLDDHETQSATEAPAQTQLHIPQRMRRAFLSICRYSDTLFNPYGITTDQYSLMLSVYRDPGIRQADIGNAMFAEPNTITAMITLLEKRGLLRRKTSPTDGRARLVYLTTRGEKLTQKLASEARHLRKLLYNCFAGEEGQVALKILDRVSEEMQRARATLAVSSADPEFDGLGAGALSHAEPDNEARVVPPLRTRTARKTAKVRRTSRLKQNTR